jgi:predicted nucleic acid-binding protein
VTSFVLDNSVAMRWCFESGAHSYADSVLNRLATGDTAIVPVLWFYEASAVLSRAQNTGMLAASKAAEFISNSNP